jgi:phosphoglycerol transferase
VAAVRESPPPSPEGRPAPPRPSRRRRRSLVAGALLAAFLSSLSVTLVTHLWSVDLHVPFQYTHSPEDDQQDATLDLMLIKDIHETGWFNTNPALNAPFKQEWVEWPMGGDLLAYTMKKAIVETTGDVPLTFNLFWLLTFPLVALAAFPALRSLRCSWCTSLVGAVLFSLAPYHFRNGAAHENLAFFVGVPVIVVLCTRILGPDAALPALTDLRHRTAWWQLRWLLLGTVLIAVTGLYYLAFLLSMVGICAIISALARRRPGRLLIALPFAVVGLATSFLANLPTLLFRWDHAVNRLGVPDRAIGAAESYPLRLVELLSPVTAHRFGPFAAVADHLYEPGREGFGTAQLGLFASIGFVCAVVTVFARATRGGERRGWSLESRLGILILAALLLAMKGGVSRALEYAGLQGVRAWSRIVIVIAFASIAVSARLLDRVRVVIRRRHWRRPRLTYISILVIVAVLGVLDQASPALMPNAGAASRERAWRADDAFVASMERRLPRGAMVFEIPVVDFPEHGAVGRMSAHDLIKEGYLHSKTLRWSAGGVRGRDGEWQWPARALSMTELVRGVTAMGFSALMLDRYGFADDGEKQVDELRALLGNPIATRGDRLAAWDLRRARPSLLAGMNADARRALAQKMLDAPQLYVSSDADPLTDRGGKHDICADGTITLVNPGDHAVREHLEITFRQRESAARDGRVEIEGRTVPIAVGSDANIIGLRVRPGTTTIKVSVETPAVRCKSVPDDALPSISVKLRPDRDARSSGPLKRPSS